MKPCQSRRSNRSAAAAFTLIELLTVVAIIAILASLLLPALARSKEKAKVVRVRVELNAIGLALEMYSDDHDGRLPPVRVNCNTDMATHWCQFPVELAQLDYLPAGFRPGMSVNMEDLFNPGHTYKYAAPGPQLMNDSPVGDFRVWVPMDFPNCCSTNGSYYSDPKSSPLRWVVWSMGPRPDSPRSRHARAPLSAHSWYEGTGSGGVLARMAARSGYQLNSE